ncbi:factor-independent urate hydroxylase [Actinomadura sp. WMMB 499]|uniref:factor-independent urate hydroxylase n=1 Tax=Actinomadura sp. WMMB 499 TaxID=1219491 RepID=UPI001244A5FD|nr:urate oxidase [Actinomadura sp. WMMB 499]QFG25171.1 urate oxidase [Actinomadura sp. WMMB 499]
MAIVLGPNRYGKAETRVVRVTRHGDRHEIKDANVSVLLSGEMADVHLTGDNAAVLPTDTQKNTVFAFAKRYGIGEIENFGLRLARHFVDARPAIGHARVEIEEYSWNRITGGHSFVRDGTEARTALVHSDGTGGRESVVSGLRDLVVLNSTGSEFHGFAVDEFTTLEPTDDRILATAVTATWRHRGVSVEWGDSYRAVREHLLKGFAETHSLSLQQTLYEMGRRVLRGRREVCEVRMSMPNRHHFLVDLGPFGMSNDNEVYFAADRPYGLIEGTVLDDDAPDAPAAWS